MTEELPVFSHNLGKKLEEWMKVSEILHHDIGDLLSAYNDDWSSQPFRRMFVRCCWALIDGEIYNLKEFTLRACELGGKSLSAKEHTFLSEVQLIADEAGAAKPKQVYVDTLKNLKETLKIAVSKFELDWLPDFGTNGWMNMSSSLKLRHRVTHPKTIAELIISDGETETHKEAFVWFQKTFGDFQTSLLRKYT